MNASSILLLFLLAGTAISAVKANCNLEPSTSTSPEHGTSPTFNDADMLGSVHQVDKIVKIEVFSGNFAFNHVVTQIKTTYKLKNGDLKDIVNGNGGNSAGSFLFDDGVYLKSVHVRQGKYVDWLQFCDTNNNCSNKYGGNKGEDANATLKKDRSVIKAFLGKDGNVIDSIRVYYETNKLYSVEMLSPDYKMTSTSVSDDSAPDARQTLDNRQGLVKQSMSLVFSESVETTETTRITTSHQYDLEVSHSSSVGVDFKMFSAGVETTFTAGSSFKTTKELTQEKTLTKTIEKEFPLVAPPQTLARADIHFNVVHYEFSWIAPTICTYTFAPFDEVEGSSFEGSLIGSQPFEEVKVVYSYEGVPTKAPSPRPTDMPTAAGPVEVMTTKPKLPSVATTPATPNPLTSATATTAAPASGIESDSLSAATQKGAKLVSLGLLVALIMFV